jgi:hypothetical protein
LEPGRRRSTALPARWLAPGERTAVRPGALQAWVGFYESFGDEERQVETVHASEMAEMTRELIAKTVEQKSEAVRCATTGLRVEVQLAGTCYWPR